MELTEIPANAPTILLVGSSRSTWQGLALPVDLGPFGMPGCRLLTSVDATLVLSAIGSSLSVPIPVPNRAPLVGTQFFAQFLMVDAPANPRGVWVSNAGAGRIGRR